MQNIFINSTQINSIPNGITNFPDLTELHLAGNQLTSLPENLCNLPENCSVNVSNNNLCSEFYYECINQWEPQNCLSITSTGFASEFKLINIYPNPFNPVTNIDFYIDKHQFISIQIFDVNGGLVEIIYDEYINLGNHSINWNSKNVSSGIYFILFKTDNHTQSHKLNLIK